MGIWWRSRTRRSTNRARRRGKRAAACSSSSRRPPPCRAPARAVLLEAACRHAKLLLEAARQTLKQLKEELEAASLIFHPRDPFPGASPCCSSRPHRRRER
nr:unnamed protein product [Digitaria exilis]